MKNHLFPGLLYMAAVLYTFSVSGQEGMTQKNCVDCHKKTNAKSFIHVPSGVSCKNCHLPNGKKHPNEDEEGFTLKEKVPALCYTCHVPLNNKKTVHPPVKIGGCLDCHEVHSSNEKKLVSLTFPDLCFFCHSSLEKKLDSAKSIHQVIRTGSSCISCHSPHQSEQPRLLIKGEKDLCLQCHSKAIEKDLRVIANIKYELDNNKFIHSAVIKNGCTGCHDPHSGVQNSLLKGSFTKATYVSGKSKDSILLCFQCHNAALLEKKVSDATGFRNGDKNLHFKHLYKAKGRNCINCHGIHSAQNEFLLVNKVKFGNWEMPLNFTKTETGGKCNTACHEAKSYSRGPLK